MALLWGDLAVLKKNLRRWAKDKRKNLDIDNLSTILVKKLKDTKLYISAKNVMLFYPLQHEVNLLDLMSDNSKNFYLPKIVGKNLACCPYKIGDILSDSCFKTKEPLTEPVDFSILDLIIVPALAVDKNNYRLGYGGGFYDRLLSTSICSTIVCIPVDLIVETIYHEEHDVPIDLIITS